MSFDRRELQSLRDRALEMAKALGSSNVLAMRAWADLAAAADRLDAYAAREGASAAPPPRAPAPVFAPRTTEQLARTVELEEPEVDEEGNPVEYYDPAAHR